MYNRDCIHVIFKPILVIATMRFHCATALGQMSDNPIDDK